MDIEQNLKLFDEGLDKDKRSASFDYCFNYFQSFREEGLIGKLAEPSHMEVSCLQLAFYFSELGNAARLIILVGEECKVLSAPHSGHRNL
jgi:hypothetical protein